MTTDPGWMMKSCFLGWLKHLSAEEFTFLSISVDAHYILFLLYNGKQLLYLYCI